MAKMVTCLLNGKPISINRALGIRDRDRRKVRKFLCTGCQDPVRAHKAGSHAAAHFEHRRPSNPDCPLSDPRVRARRKKS
jgi:hypothetical protein